MKLQNPLASLLGAIALCAVANAETYSIDGHIISSGAALRSSNACFALDSVIAEPIAGYSSGGAYDLFAGFAYTISTVNDTIFSNSFEDCAP